MTDARKPIGWVRNDRRITWWGADYPVNWAPGEGFAIYGEPAQAQADAVTAELSITALHAYCLRQAESNDDDAVRYDVDADDWAENPDPMKAKRADNSRRVAASCRAQAAQFRMWGRALSAPLSVERLRVALSECQDKLWIARCDSGDEKFRAAAERACDMATEALKVPEPTPVCGTCNDHGMIGGPVGQTAESLDFITEACPDCTARYAAFRAGWRTNAALPADDPEYFERCTEADWQLYLKQGPEAYNAALNAGAEEMEAEAARAVAGGPIRSADHLFDLIAGSLFDHPNKAAPEGAVRLLADDLWAMHLGRSEPGSSPFADEAALKAIVMDLITHRRAGDFDLMADDVANALWPIVRGQGVWNPYQITPNDIAAILDENADTDAEGLLNASQLAEKVWRAGLTTALGDADSLKAATEALEKCWGALNFILAFYEPGQRHLDTNAWKQAEASGRRAHARARIVLDALKVEPEDEENPWRTQSEWSDLLRLRDDFIVNEGLWSSFTDHLEKVEQLARKS